MDTTNPADFDWKTLETPSASDYHKSMGSPGVLSRWKLSALRAARRLRVIDAYLWYRRHIQGDICTLVPFDDPLDASHLLVALAERVAAHSEDHIEIGAEKFDHWMNAATRTHPNYDAIKCFRELRKGLSFGRAQLAAPGCFIYGEGPKIVIDVYHRRGQGPKLTRGQMHRFMASLFAQDRINQNVIASLREEALSRDWPSPFPELRDDQPVEIIIDQVSLTQRIKRFLARIR